MSTNMNLLSQLKWLASSASSDEMKDRIDLLEEVKQKELDRFIFVAKNKDGEIISHSYFPTSQLNAKVEADNFRNIYQDANIEVCKIPADIAKDPDFQETLTQDCFDNCTQQQLNSYLRFFSSDTKNMYSSQSEPAIDIKNIFSNKDNSLSIDKVGTNSYNVYTMGKQYSLNTSLELDKLEKNKIQEFLKGKPIAYNRGGVTIDSPLTVIQLEKMDNDTARVSYKVPILSSKGKTIYAEVNTENGKQMMSNFALHDKTTYKTYQMDMEKTEMTKENMNKLRQIMSDSTQDICKGKTLDSSLKNSVDKKALLTLGKGAVKATVALAKQADQVAGIG